MPDRKSASTNTLNKNDSKFSKTRDSVDKKDHTFDLTSVCFIIGVALLVRMSTSYYPYSGANKPPMYGDYEAQRHWQEITFNLPISQWYSNSSKNDLQYWGLDYPPLTAYHSWLVAHAAVHSLDPDSVEIRESRGYESKAHKYFMRLSVLVVDLLIFIPAVLHFSFATLKQRCNSGEKKNVSKAGYLSLATILLYPGLILIDYGHFQYNCVSLGLFVAAVSLLLQDHVSSASCFFVLALNYKQMELYHALPFFFYILGINLFSHSKSFLSGLFSIIIVALTVVKTFLIVWTPFLLLKNVQVLQDAVLRLFPLQRGIFEDKVANIWCAINVLFKLRNHFSNSQLALTCLATTACALLPSSVDLLFRPSKDKFLLALINSSLSFFLFSFQVHEKSILLVAIPVLLQFNKDPLCCFWFSIISVFSMLPLLIKDELFVAYVASLVFFITMVSWIEPKVFQNSIDRKTEDKKIKSKSDSSFHTFVSNHINKLFGLSMLGVFLISACSMLLNPPKRYPDLFPLLVSVYSCCHFCAFLVYFNYKQIFATSASDKTKKTL